jgi:hypothetical protein
MLVIVIVLVIVIEHPASDLLSSKLCYDQTTPPRIEFAGKICKQPFVDAFDKDVDLTRATEPPAGIKREQLRLTVPQNFVCAHYHFVFEATGTDRADGRAIVADQHSRTGPPIT